MDDDDMVASRVVSFDVGLKNFSLCIIDMFKQKIKIRKWLTVSIKGKNISEYVVHLIEKLRTSSFGVVEHVLIEQQINRNTQMKVLSHIIQTFFICEMKVPPNRIEFVNPKLRVDCTDILYSAIVSQVKFDMNLTRVLTRKEFKNISIGIARKILSKEEHSDWSTFFENLTKKDYYADSLVQAVAWKSQTSVHEAD